MFMVLYSQIKTFHHWADIYFFILPHTTQSLDFQVPVYQYLPLIFRQSALYIPHRLGKLVCYTLIEFYISNSTLHKYALNF